jgi:hypothetical protein
MLNLDQHPLAGRSTSTPVAPTRSGESLGAVMFLECRLPAPRRSHTGSSAPFMGSRAECTAPMLAAVTSTIAR